MAEMGKPVVSLLARKGLARPADSPRGPIDLTLAGPGELARTIPVVLLEREVLRRRIEMTAPATRPQPNSKKRI